MKEWISLGSMALLRRLKGENEHGGATFREKRSDLKKATLLNRGGGGGQEQAVAEFKFSTAAKSGVVPTSTEG